MEGEVVAELSSEFFNAVNCDLGGVIEVVNDDRPVPPQQQLKNGVAANVARTAGHQDILRHYRRAQTLREPGKKKGKLRKQRISEKPKPEVENEEGKRKTL